MASDIYIYCMFLMILLYFSYKLRLLRAWFLINYYDEIIHIGISLELQLLTSLIIFLYLVVVLSLVLKERSLNTLLLSMGQIAML